MSLIYMLCLIFWLDFSMAGLISYNKIESFGNLILDKWMGGYIPPPFPLIRLKGKYLYTLSLWPFLKELLTFNFEFPKDGDWIDNYL